MLGGRHRATLDLSALGGPGNNLTANGTGAAEADRHPAAEAAAAKVRDRGARERRAKSVERYEKTGADALTMDMWVDGDHHTERLATSTPSGCGCAAGATKAGSTGRSPSRRRRTPPTSPG
ncbi:hypothetical protein [Streptomyces sp. NPDC001100]